MNNAVSSNYWFGRRGDRLFLYDSTFQPQVEEDVFLWELEPQQMRFFKRKRIRPLLCPTVFGPDVARGVAAYEAWRAAEGPRYLEEHLKRIKGVAEAGIRADEKRGVEAAQTLARAARAASAHKTWLRRMKPYPGVDMPSDATISSHASFCWSCKTSVYSDTNPRCRACGWLVCECGACECSRSYAP